MDMKRFKNLITCDVCFEIYDETYRCPRVLSCGHTFCHSCLEKILLKSPKCPSCKVRIRYQVTKSIPVNFTVKSMISVFEKVIPITKVQNKSLLSRESTFVPIKLEAVRFCAEHHNLKELQCMDCGHWICCVCSKLKHKNCRTLRIRDAYIEHKEKASQKVQKELELRKFANNCVNQAMKSLEEQRKKMELNIKECEKKSRELRSWKPDDFKYCESLIRLRIAVESALNENEFSNAMDKLDTLMVQGKKLLSQLNAFEIISPRSPPSVEALMTLSEIQPVFALSNEDKILYGEVKVFKGQIWVSSFQAEKPKGLLFPFKELLSRFNGSSEIPSKAFLKLASEGGLNEEVDVVIETDGTSPRAKNFLYLCSVLKGEKCKGRILNQSLSLCELSSPDPPSATGGVIEDYSRMWPPLSKEGDVAGKFNSGCDFWISLSGGLQFPFIKFGVVVSGLQKLKEFGISNLIVKDCGLVI